jgi:hypothetical protein
MALQTSVSEHRTQRDHLAKNLLSEVGRLSELLRHLDERDRDCIVALVAATQLFTVYERSDNRPDVQLTKQFESAIATLAPVAARRIAVSSLTGACLTESLGYAKAMAGCLKDKNKTQDQCERDSAPQAAAEIICVMKALDEMIKHIREIVPGPVPGPQPMPI